MGANAGCNLCTGRAVCLEARKRVLWIMMMGVKVRDGRQEGAME
jgi:hypothetical protein